MRKSVQGDKGGKRREGEDREKGYREGNWEGNGMGMGKGREWISGILYIETRGKEKGKEMERKREKDRYGMERKRKGEGEGSDSRQKGEGVGVGRGERWRSGQWTDNSTSPV